MTDIRLGFENGSGEAVAVSVIYMLLTGITRHGKSEAIKAMAERVAESGYTVLLFDVKAKRDYEDVGREVLIYIDEATDPTTVKGLLENQSGMSMSFQYSEIIKAYEPGDDYGSMLERVESMMEEDIHPIEEDKLRVLRHLLQDLVSELRSVEIVDELDLRNSVNVMDINRVDDAIQRLAIASTVVAVLDGREDVILCVDEAHNFTPQKGQPPANQPLTNVIR